MIKVADKILRLDKPNGVFIIFAEYDSEEVFNSFLRFISQNLGANVADSQQYPYSISAKISFPFGEATAICQEGIGCAIRIKSGEDSVVENIIKRCAKITN